MFKFKCCMYCIYICKSTWVTHFVCLLQQIINKKVSYILSVWDNDEYILISSVKILGIYIYLKGSEILFNQQKFDTFDATKSKII